MDLSRFFRFGQPRDANGIAQYQLAERWTPTADLAPQDALKVFLGSLVSNVRVVRVHSQEDLDTLVLSENDVVCIEGWALNEDARCLRIKANATELARFTDPATDYFVWVGSKSGGQPMSGDGEVPAVVSFYTDDQIYREHAERLRRSLVNLGMADQYVVKIPPFQSWYDACAFKPLVVRYHLQTLKRPVLWVDADATVQRQIDDISWKAFDFGIHRFRGWQFSSGTTYFNNTPAAHRLVDRWVELSLMKPLLWDQLCLQQAYHEVAAEGPIAAGWLPREYLEIFDNPVGPKPENPAIVHFQASRRKFAKKRGRKQGATARVKPQINPRFVRDVQSGSFRVRDWPDLPKKSAVGGEEKIVVNVTDHIEMDYRKLVKHVFDACDQIGRRPVVVEVGAMDGKSFDDLYPFLITDKAQALLIEPLPDMFERLQQTYKQTKNISFEKVAIDVQRGSRDIHRIDPDAVGGDEVPDWADGISSFHTDKNALGGKQVGPEMYRKLQSKIRTERVDTIPLGLLLSDRGIDQIDVLQIDTEGHDLTVLSTLDLVKHQPKVIYMEYYNLTYGEKLELLDILESAGYAYEIQRKDICATLLRIPTT